MLPTHNINPAIGCQNPIHVNVPLSNQGSFYQLLSHLMCNTSELADLCKLMKQFIKLQHVANFKKKNKRQYLVQHVNYSQEREKPMKGYGDGNIRLRSTFSLQYGHVCFLPTIHQPRIQNSWNLRVS